MLHYGIPGTEGGVLTDEPAGQGAPSTAGPSRRPGRGLAEIDERTGVAAFRDFIFFTVFQPIVDLATSEPVGYEALCRFADGRPPQERLDAASDTGAGVDLDGAMLRASLAAAASLPEGAWVSVNVSAALWDARRRAGLHRERVHLPGGPRVRRADRRSASCRPPTCRSASRWPSRTRSSATTASARSSSAGRRSSSSAGRPQRASSSDAARRALLAALVPFAAERDCQVVASGVETAAERDALRSCGVELAQGFFLGLPAPAGRGARRRAVAAVAED